EVHRATDDADHLGGVGDVDRGVALAGQPVVADTGREDLLQAVHLGRGRLPLPVEALGDGRGDRHEVALVDVAGDRAAGLDARGGVQLEVLRARALGPVVEDAVPHARAAGDLGAVGGQAAVLGQLGCRLGD